MAQAFIKTGKEVIIAGRTEANLKKTAQEIGAKAYYVVDVGDFKTLDALVDKIVKEHPEIDCLINNAGIQKPIDFTGKVDENDWMSEININITGLIKLWYASISSNLFISH